MKRRAACLYLPACPLKKHKAEKDDIVLINKEKLRDICG